MNGCHEFDELWVAYLDDELPAEVRARMDAHLGRCERCAAELNGFGRALAAVDALEGESPSESFRRSFWERFERERADAPAGFWRRLFQPRWVLVWGSGLAASLAAALLWVGPEPAAPRPDPAEALIASHLDLFTDFEAIRQMELLDDLDVIAQLDEE